jgi:hypothetical protein
MYLDPLRPGVEDLIDEIIAGVQARGPTRARSASPGLHEVAVVGTQSAAGHPEGMPLPTSWWTDARANIVISGPFLRMDRFRACQLP